MTRTHDSDPAVRGPQERTGLELGAFLDWGRDLHHQGRYEDAVRAFELILGVDGGNEEALIGRNRAVRRAVPRWHWEMLHDEERAELYDRAIRQAVAADPDALVLDIGAGSGLLAMMAARAGAREVVACEGQPAVAATTTRVVRAAGYDDAVTVVSKMSTRMSVPADLPRRAGVLVTEIVDCGLLGEGILGTIAHAREHLLTPDATIMPSRGRIVAQLVESDALHRKNHVGKLYGFDLAPFNRLSTLEYFDSRLHRHEHRVLSEPVTVFDFDFHTADARPRRTGLRIHPTAPGTVHAVVFWFEMELLPGITVGNAPDRGSHWKQAVQCLQAPPRVRPGEPVAVDAAHDGEYVRFEVTAGAPAEEPADRPAAPAEFEVAS
ncbi:50S ribosomal protein L11 methyltransferase [Actinomadura sp. NAK00032]|uniref:50S ribosomal protein L11 methyltransferase n=1 Tax=Actinomadura sp. NAK00032 TaxID=2742128 RepID=UPI001590D186|nr:50S ribosomal protein L11 methyltransferase [Actinomadura sp. NAK00032]QKW32647.1 50S ribosomal protein L11 methyltransferase [Actinomadura sp. NAK00032]